MEWTVIGFSPDGSAISRQTARLRVLGRKIWKQVVGEKRETKLQIPKERLKGD